MYSFSTSWIPQHQKSLVIFLDYSYLHFISYNTILGTGILTKSHPTAKRKEDE